MDEITKQILISLSTNYITTFTSPMLINFFRNVFKIRSEIENDLKAARTSKELEKVFREAIGVIDAQAGSGLIEVSHTFLDALRGIRFDHQDGTVVIAGSTVCAPLVQTGGIGSGQTEISNSVLQSQGAKVECSADGKIKMSGDAHMSLS